MMTVAPVVEGVVCCTFQFFFLHLLVTGTGSFLFFSHSFLARWFRCCGVNGAGGFVMSFVVVGWCRTVVEAVFWLAGLVTIGIWEVPTWLSGITVMRVNPGDRFGVQEDTLKVCFWVKLSGVGAIVLISIFFGVSSRGLKKPAMSSKVKVSSQAAWMMSVEEMRESSGSMELDGGENCVCCCDWSVFDDEALVVGNCLRCFLCLADLSN